MKAVVVTRYGGPDVLELTAGDQVFGSRGDKFGAHAEFACVAEDGFLAIKRANIRSRRRGRCS